MKMISFSAGLCYWGSILWLCFSASTTNNYILGLYLILAAIFWKVFEVAENTKK